MQPAYSEDGIMRLHRIHHLLSDYLGNAEIAGKFPVFQALSRSELGVLQIVSDKPGVLVGTVAATLHLGKSTCTGVVDRLERRGYLSRRIASGDRRSFELVLTDVGEDAQAQHLAYERLIYTNLLNRLDDSTEVDRLLMLLEKIVEGLGKEGEVSDGI